MTADRYQGNIITKNPTTPTGPYETGAAPGVWSVEEANEFTKAGVWPTAGNLPTSVEDVFSTYLYDGTGSTQTITNGINLSGEGGLVWTKSQSDARNHALHDSARGVTCLLKSNANNAEYCDATQMASFNSDGFTVGTDGSSNTNGDEYASWTFRKAPKFFDVVGGLTSDSSGNLASFNHNLGSTPGMVILKATNSASNWVVYHNSSPNSYTYLNDTAAAATSSGWATATDSTFTVNSGSLLVPSVNYVAYLFAHNNGDGEFGPTGDQDIIKCGYYTGNGSSTGPEVDLGFEPQFLLVKPFSHTGNWFMWDVMRGLPADVPNSSASLYPNLTNAEFSEYGTAPRPDGFQITDNNAAINTSGNNYIYMAIRRGPMKEPTAATDVFAMDTDSNTIPMMTSGWPPDMSFLINTNGSNQRYISSRLTKDGRIQSNQTNAIAYQSEFALEFTGAYSWSPNISDYLAWMFRRYPSFFDVATWIGDGSAGRTIPHNLGIAPEMMWVKKRSGVESWAVYHKLNGGTHFARLQTTAAFTANSNLWDNTDTTASVFTVDTDTEVNESASTYIAYLFASLDGISKVGSYTGNGSTQTIDCGFTSGARYVLVKRYDSTGDWYVWDTNRGIVAGNDSHVSLNTGDAPITTDDSVDPDSSGFAVNQNTATNINVSSATYIFYAIA